jgi:hypothetical protein
MLSRVHDALQPAATAATAVATVAVTAATSTAAAAAIPARIAVAVLGLAVEGRPAVRVPADG